MNVRRVLVVARVGEGSGPAQKLQDVASAFERLGWDVELRLFPVSKSGISGMGEAIDLATVTLLYLRSDPGLILLRRSIRAAKSRGMTIVIDVPTPMAPLLLDAWRRGKRQPSQVARLARTGLITPLAWVQADLLVEYDEDMPPWSLLAKGRRLRVTNGVDIETRPINTDWSIRDSHRMAIAANLNDYHGYERLIDSMCSHNGFRLDVAGDGPAFNALRQRAAELNLQDRVEFHGHLGGSELDRFFMAADVGIGTLGGDQPGAISWSPLKTREYLARGMPVVYSGDDPDLRSRPPFTYRIPPCENRIDLVKVAAWLGSLRRVEGMPTEIRAFARANLDMKTRMEHVIRSLPDLPH